MRNHVVRNRTNMKCNSCGELYNPQVGCGCWVTSRSNAIATFDGILKKGGCKACGSRAHFPQEKPGEICPDCDRHGMNRQTSISAIAAGLCPVCYGLPHRRDMEHCTGCGEAYADIQAEELDAWAGYGAFPVEEILPATDHWRGYMVIPCPVCKKHREFHLSMLEAEVVKHRPCIVCSQHAVHARRKGKKNGTSI